MGEIKPVAWMTPESKWRLSRGGNCKGAVPVHGKPSKGASTIPLYDQSAIDALRAEVERLTVVEEVLRRIASKREGAIILMSLIDEELTHLNGLLDDVIARCEVAATQERC